MDLVETSDVRGIQSNVLKCLMINISSIWPLRTQTVRITSQRNFIGMDCCKYTLHRQFKNTYMYSATRCIAWNRT